MFFAQPLRITWNNAAGAKQYKLYWSNDSSVNETNYAGILTTGSMPYDHTNLTNGATYYYNIMACNGAGCSRLSGTVNKTFQTTPVKPTNLVLTQITDGFRITWNNVTGATQYKIYWGNDSSVSEAFYSTILTTGSTPYDHTNLTNGDKYYYSIMACNVAGCSSLSSTVNKTFQPQYTINPQSYTKLDAHGNDLTNSAPSWSMVRDNVTGLIWEMKTNMEGGQNYNDPHEAVNTYTWYDPAASYSGTPGNGTDTADFIHALNDANYGNYSDWRLPTVEELRFIVDYENCYPSINNSFFPNTIAQPYWSYSLWNTLNYIWIVGFSPGGYIGESYENYYVRAVRGNRLSANTFVDNQNETVTETVSKLMWQKSTADDAMTWEQAIAFCECSKKAGYEDWRLPSINEQTSLLKDEDSLGYSHGYFTSYFPDTKDDLYWSYTTHPCDPAWAFCQC